MTPDPIQVAVGAIADARTVDEERHPAVNADQIERLRAACDGLDLALDELEHPSGDDVWRATLIGCLRRTLEEVRP